MKYCPNCGTRLKSSSQFCHECGQRITDDNDLPEYENKRSIRSGKAGRIIVIALLTIVVCAGVLFFLRGQSRKSFAEDSKRIEEATQSVVMVYTYDNMGNMIATGSGFVVYDDSTIVTNNHVTEDAYEIKVSTEQDLTYDIESVLAYDVTKDIILLKTSIPTGLTPLKIGSSRELLKGDNIVAIGSPIGLKNTVSTGILSGRVYDYDMGMDVLQISAPISHGSSGGALFDETGSVVGITFAGYDEGQNLNFAIPAEVMESISVLEVNLSVFDYLLQVNPAQKMQYDYSDFYVEMSDLLADPNKYDNTRICCVLYLYRKGQTYIAYESEEDVGLENEYHRINYINCDLIGDSIDIKLANGKGAYVIVRGGFHYTDGYAPGESRWTIEGYAADAKINVLGLELI